MTWMMWLTSEESFREEPETIRSWFIHVPATVVTTARKMTMKLVGKVEQYDQRDHPMARAYLVPGTMEYEEYYGRHPELKEWDDENRRRRGKEEARGRVEDPIGSQFGPSVFYSRRVLGLPEIVEGKVAARHKIDIDEKVKADPQAIARIIKSYARYLGAATVRITPLNQSWVYTNYARPYTLEPYGKLVDLNYRSRLSR